MPIKYSLSAHPSNPSDKENKSMKVYARIQYDQIVTLEDLARHIHDHGSPFNEAVIEGVLLEMVNCIHEQIVDGNRVQLGKLGTLQAALRSKGADSPDNFQPEAYIEAIEVNWTPSEKFKNLKNDPNIKYEQVLTRKGMTDALKEAHADIIEDMDAAGSGSGPGTNPNPGPLE